MHEAGLAQQVIDACAAELRARGGCHATRVGLRIGALSAVDPEALRFCFDALCAAEYHDPEDRRFQAQPVVCQSARSSDCRWS